MNGTSRPAFGVGAALLSGVLLGLSRDVGPFGPLMLVAPTPVLVYALAAPRARQVAAAAFGAQSLGSLSLVYAYAGIIPLPALAILLVVQSAMFALILLITRLTARGARPGIAVLSYPCLAAATEFLFGLVNPHGSFGATGYALVDIVPLLQLASIGGLPALAFAGGLFAMGCAMLVASPASWRSVALVAAFPLGVFLLFGVLRVHDPYEEKVRIGLGSINSLTGQALRGERPDLQVAQAYADLARQAAARKPAIVVFPEKVFAQAAQPLQAAARETGIPIVAGFDEILPDGRRVNSARLFAPDGLQRRYLKRRLIPGVELGYAAGHRPLIVGDHGIAICKDMDYPRMLRGYDQRGVRLMLVPAWDFVVDGRLHARMAVVRGVEGGFAVARAAAEGRLTLSDRYGRVVAEAVTSRSSPTLLVSELGLRAGGTFYARVGDLIGWLLVAAGTTMLLFAGGQMGKNRRSGHLTVFARPACR